MRRSLLAVASLFARPALLAAIVIGLGACTPQAAPTPDVEELAKAIANTWATQTAVAATSTAAVLPTATEAAQRAPSGLTRPAETSAPATQPPATPVPATQAPLPSPTPIATNTPRPTNTLPPTSTPRPFKTFTPGPTSTAACPIPVSPELAGGWNRAALGCPVEDAAVIWAAWEPFQHGMMIWRSDTDEVYALIFADGATLNRGPALNGGDAWRWDNSFPNGRDLMPPAGFYEPVRGFGYVWYNFLAGPTGSLGWATQPEQGICVTRQEFEGGTLVRSSTVSSCQDNLMNMASSSGFTPLFLTIGADGQWQRH